MNHTQNFMTYCFSKIQRCLVCLSPEEWNWFVLVLVGNVADMSPRVVATPTMSAENGRRHNVADVVTGFKAGSRVGLVIYLAFFYLDIYLVIFSRLHDSDVSVAPTTGTGRSNGRGIVQTSHGCTCDVHHFCGNTALLSVRTAHGFGGLLRGPGNGTGRTHHLFCFCLRERSFTFLVCKLINFFLNIRK